MEVEKVNQKNNDKNLCFTIMKEHIIELFKLLEKKRFEYANNSLKNKELLKINMFHDNTCKFINQLLENLLNYIHHMINSKMDQTLNEIFDEIRMAFFMHNSCVIQKYVDIFKIIYDNISPEQLDYTSLDNYIDSIECECKLTLKIFQNEILKNLTECDIRCKMAYDPQINPIKINIETNNNQ
jgi:hypothetical protein